MINNFVLVCKYITPRRTGLTVNSGFAFVEFDVPSGVLVQGGKPGWSIISGPGSMYDKLKNKCEVVVPEFSNRGTRIRQPVLDSNGNWICESKPNY